MSRSVLSLWERARSYIDPLPIMSPLTSEPAIVDFMFEKGCNVSVLLCEIPQLTICCSTVLPKKSRA